MGGVVAEGWGGVSEHGTVVGVDAHVEPGVCVGEIILPLGLSIMLNSTNIIELEPSLH